MGNHAPKAHQTARQPQPHHDQVTRTTAIPNSPTIVSAERARVYVEGGVHRACSVVRGVSGLNHHPRGSGGSLYLSDPPQNFHQKIVNRVFAGVWWWSARVKFFRAIFDFAVSWWLMGVFCGGVWLRSWCLG